jgi:sugar lactone lactonase YvrE
LNKEVVAGGIARDHDGFIYVADTFNGRIQKFAP